MLGSHLPRLARDPSCPPPDLLARLPDSYLSRDLPLVRERVAKRKALEDAKEAAAREKREVKFGAWGHCKKCGTRLIDTHKQTRSGDEGMTVWRECITCDQRWKL